VPHRPDSLIAERCHSRVDKRIAVPPGHLRGGEEDLTPGLGRQIVERHDGGIAQIADETRHLKTVRHHAMGTTAAAAIDALALV